MKTAAIYCRVSSDGQEENTSLDTQHEACLKRSEELPCNVQYTFREAYSGLTLNRPELEELRELNQASMGKTYFGITSRISKAKTIQHPQDKWISLPDASPPIVSEELFHQANSQLTKPKARTGRPKNDYLLRHHVFCAVCGRPLVGHCLNKKYRYYQCSTARPIENAEHACRARLVRACYLENTAKNCCGGGFFYS